MKSNKVLLVLIFLSGMVSGAFLMGWYTSSAVPPAPRACSAPAPAADLLFAPLDQATLPQDMQEVEKDELSQPRSASEIPSQLVRADLPEDIVLGIQPAPSTQPQPAGIPLDDIQNAVVLQAQKPAHRAADGSSITMIEAPVALKRIETLDAYKQFKRTARGSYPSADFTKEEVWVLESQSNLPDKAFEIVEIIPAEKQVKVLYRVNVLGLDKKTNTHSAQKTVQTKLPVVLEQVL